MTDDPGKFGTVGLSLLELLAATYPEDTGMRVTLVAGAIIPDDWCWSGCGAVYGRLDAVYPTTDFPVPLTHPAPPGTPLAARWAVGVHRAVAGMDNAGNPPDPVRQSNDALALMHDAWILRCALLPWVKEQAHRGGAMLGNWTPVGPLGDCAGGYWPVTIRM